MNVTENLKAIIKFAVRPPLKAREGGRIKKL